MVKLNCVENVLRVIALTSTQSWHYQRTGKAKLPLVQRLEIIQYKYALSKITLVRNTKKKEKKHGSTLKPGHTRHSLKDK